MVRAGLSVCVVILLWGQAPGDVSWSSQRQAASPSNGPSCTYTFNDPNEVDCYNFGASDMQLLERILDDAAQLMGSFNLFIGSSDGPALPSDLLAAYNLTYVGLTSDGFTEMPYEFLSNIRSPIYGLVVTGNTFSSTELQPTELLLPFSEHLSYLEIQSNNIVSIEQGTFSQFTALNFLELAYNNISAVGLEYLGLNELLELALYGNFLSVIEDGAFRDLQNLQTLRLDVNQLVTLQEGAFSGLEDSPISDIYLADNPWNCTCDLQWLKDWLEVRNLTEASGAYCEYPVYAPFNNVTFC